MEKTRIHYGLLSLFSLAMGIGIYLFLRDINNMLLFEWIPKARFNTGYLPLTMNPSWFSHVLMYNLPDMLWFLSAILFFRFIWFLKAETQKVYILCFYVFGIIFEISQLSKNVPGAFDWLDLFLMVVGAFVEGLLYNVFVKRRFV